MQLKHEICEYISLLFMLITTEDGLLLFSSVCIYGAPSAYD